VPLPALYGLVVAASACAATDHAAPSPPTLELLPARPIDAEPQREGDPARGRDALLNQAFVPCGIPRRVYAELFGEPNAADLMPDRTGQNATLPYFFTSYTPASGIELVSPNCLSCHAARLDGELIVGLGDHSSDFTANQYTLLTLLAGLATDAEQAELDVLLSRSRNTAQHIVLSTVGVNSADGATKALAAHLDPITLEWHEEPQLDVSGPTVPLDVPPWWHLQKKNALYYSGSGRGDHARLLMIVATACLDSPDAALEIDSLTPHLRAYLATITAPAWPWAIDEELAIRGEALFESNCSRCHGTYGEPEAYPNLIVDIDDVGTDPLYLTQSAFHSAGHVDWFARSIWGEVSRIAPSNGYIAPPLDGIWATAPYLHNGSVPTLAAVLDPSIRPSYWRRTFDDSDYDPAAVGWHHEVLDYGKDGSAAGRARSLLYDTTLPGYGNGGHTYAAHLSDEDRAALLEYLKTL
jgi:mono/diheme cytochrome c family protein